MHHTSHFPESNANIANECLMISLVGFPVLLCCEVQQPAPAKVEYQLRISVGPKEAAKRAAAIAQQPEDEVAKNDPFRLPGSFFPLFPQTGLPVGFYLKTKETGHAGGLAVLCWARIWPCWARDVAVLGALGWVGRGFWVGALGWLCWAGLGVGFGFCVSA